MRKLIVAFMVVLAGCGRVDFDRNKLLFLHNEQRMEQKLEILQFDGELNQKAQEHAEWMASAGRLQHSKLQNSYPVRGENIAMGQRDEVEVLTDWMNSTGHRKNIMNPAFQYIGLGHAKRKDRDYWCAVFGGSGQTTAPPDE